ncbi:hypothetical protein PTNB73_08184 [Pyrenophora teres f. teres]|nr:hypothetical protein PTNB73_08184 [Pyrenophora teres f. teres]
MNAISLTRRKSSLKASQSIRGRVPEREPREKTRNEHVQLTQQSQEVEELPGATRRGSRARKLTKKAQETLEDTIEISSTEEVSSEDDTDAGSVAEEVLVTRTTRKVTRKVTRKLPKKPSELEMLSKSMVALQAQFLAFQKSREDTEEFPDIETMDVTEDSPPKDTRKKRKPSQPKKPSLHASNKPKKQKKRA